MKIRIVILAFLLTCGWLEKAQAQQVEKGYEILEIVKLAETYKRTPSLSYAVHYTFADSAHPTTFLEEVFGSTKISNGNYWSVLDTVEMVQGGQYALAVFSEDSTIIVSDRKEYGEALSLPFLDSAFRSANVDSMSITTVDASTRMLAVFFKPGSAYEKYTLTYDYKKYLTSEIKYFVPNVPVTADESVIGTGVITLTVSSYSTAAIDQSVFNESKFVYKQNGQLVAKPAYAAFTIIDNTTH